MSSGDLIVVPPSINPDDHGLRIIIAGGIMLSAVAIMVFITFSNRYISKTMLQLDSLGMMLGGVLSIIYFVIWAVAVGHGFGKHRDVLSKTDIDFVQTLIGCSMFVFFCSHGVIKLSFNLLARRTGRSRAFKTCIDVFSAFILGWTLVNIIVVATAFANRKSPNRVFLWISGITSIFIVIGQISAFMWIIWHTMTSKGRKIEWSFSMGCLVPLCVAAICLRLAWTPVNYFDGDWTIDDVWSGVTLLIELNMVIITVLAPNLPNFFDKTSTGGVYYLPGEAKSRNAAERRSRRMIGLDSTFDSNNSQARVLTPTIVAGESAREWDNDGLRQSSFGSDVIMVRHSINIKTSSPAGSRSGLPSEDKPLPFRDMFE